MPIDYIFNKGKFEGQAIKNTNNGETSFIIWSTTEPLEMLTKVLEDKTEVLTYKIKKEDAIMFQQILTKLLAAPDKRTFEYSPSTQEKISLISKLKRWINHV